MLRAIWFSGIVQVMKNFPFACLGFLLVIPFLLSTCQRPPVDLATKMDSSTAESGVQAEESTQPSLQPIETVPAGTSPGNTPQEEGLIGGTLTIAMSTEIVSLDPQKTISSSVLGYIYSSLIVPDPQGSGYLPYLASSWETSEDGTKYTFHLRHDVRFHNGDPLTAQDVVFTFQRAIDPATVSPATGSDLHFMKSISALDDYTVEITMDGRNYYMIDFLSYDTFEGILSQNAVTQYGDLYGRNPVGTGPYLFKEWVNGDHLTLERNPDFTWGPEFTHGMPPNIQTVIVYFLPETAIISAGLEAGEIDFVYGRTFTPLEINNLAETGMFDILRYPAHELNPFIILNTSQPPFDDILVRLALSHATDKQAVMDMVAYNSGAVVQNGPLSATMEGYWSGIEEMGYDFDLEKARELMQNAGYQTNANGVLEKDGQPFTIELNLINGSEISNQCAEILRAQWRELGIDVQLLQMDRGMFYEKMISGNYTASLMKWGFPNSDIINQLFASRNIGGSNYGHVNDPQLDMILDNMTITTDVQEHLHWAQEAQKRIVEQEYIVTLFSQATGDIVTKRVKNYTHDPISGFRIWNAYLGD